MNRLIPLLMMILLWPNLAAARQQALNSDAPQVAAGRTDDDALRPPAAPETSPAPSATPTPAPSATPTDAARRPAASFDHLQAPRPPQAVPGPRRPRPEGSMVGYIDNAIVGSQTRIRFDSGFDNALPDRAEFFYAKCGCYQGLAAVIPQAYDPQASGPGPGVPTTVNFQEASIDVEYAPRPRFSISTAIPVRWLQPQGFQAIPPFPGFSNQSGLGDVLVGVKAAVAASDDRDVTAQFRVFLPSGDGSKGVGTDHSSVEPALLYHERVSERFALESEAGVRIPVGGNAGVPTAGSSKFSGSVVFYGIGPSYLLYDGPRVRFAPVVELVGWHVVSGFETLPGGPLLGAAADVGGTNIVNLKFGARTTIDAQDSIYVGYGRALTDAAWYKDILRIEYRHSF